jgi:hypothetical protein
MKAGPLFQGVKRAEIAGMAVLVNHIVPVEVPRHADAQRLLDYWRAVMQEFGDFRMGRDIPSRPIASLLKNIVINEPTADRSDMRVRLSGSAVRRRFDGKMDGRLLSEVFTPAEFAQNLVLSNRALATGKPVMFDSVVKRRVVEELHAEVVLLPIVDRDGITPLLLVGIFYFG